MKFDVFLEKLAENNIEFDRKRILKLKEYWDLLVDYNNTVHLFSKRGGEAELAKQFYDVILLDVFLPEYEELIDAGSGAGFVGIILAILNQYRSFILVERSKKKAVFLENTALKIGLGNVDIRGSDITELEFEADVLVSKASCMRDILETNLMNFVKVGGIFVHFSTAQLPPPYKNYMFRNPFRNRSIYLSVLERVV